MHPIIIPVKPYVKKYITAKYHCLEWHYTRNDRLGKYFYALLQRKPLVFEKYKLQAERLTVLIPPKHEAVRGTYLDQDAVDDFNEFVYEEIVEGIISYITGLAGREGMKKYGRIYIKEVIKDKTKKRQVQNPELMQFFEIKEVIADHLMRYNITENDIQIETVRKNVYRRMGRLLKEAAPAA
jgi:hypothetical protein